jgi:putative addiction module component (TIGR02574 family)
MSPRAQERLGEAMALPVKDRADLGAELLTSLDTAATEDPAEVEAAWAEEIARRARRVISGESVGIPWDEVRRRAEAALRRQGTRAFG